MASEDSERLSQRGVRNIPSVLVEFPGKKDSSRENHRFVQLMDDRGLADPGIAGDQIQYRCSGGDHPIEGSQQGLALLVTSVQFLGYQQSV
jgi:hypothetical protein